MAFEATRFSENGLQLLAQLTTSKTLKVKYIYVDSAEHPIEDLEQPPSWWATNTAATMAIVDPELILAGTQETQARLRVKLKLKTGVTTTQTIKTIVICACAVESGTEGDTITFCGVIDPTGVEVLYHGGSSINTSTAVSIYFTLSNASSITVETMANPDFVIASDLDRYMTCHKVSDAYGGDNQNVYGIKYFTNLVSDMTNGIKFGEGTENTYFSIDCSDWYMAFNASEDGTQGNVTPIYKFKNNNTDIIKVELDRTGNESLYTTTFTGKISTGSLYTNEIGSDSTYIRLCGDLIPKDGSNGYSLGSENNYFSSVYSNRFYGDGFTSSLIVDIYTMKTEIADGLTFSQYTGETLNNFSNIHFLNDKLYIAISRSNCIEITSGQTKIDNNLVALGSIDAQGGLRVSQGITAINSLNDIGTNSIKFNNVWANHLHGMIPTPDEDSTAEIPIGAIVCLNGLPVDKHVGSIIKGTYYLCSLTGVPDNRSVSSSESYRLLTSTTSGVTWALAMRIS